MIVLLFVGREKSIRALEEVMKADKFILLATQKNATDERPGHGTVHRTLRGCLPPGSRSRRQLPNRTVKVLVEGMARAAIRGYTRTEDYYEAEAELVADENADAVEIEALARSVVSEFEGYVKLNKKVSAEVVAAVTQIDDYSKLADTVASHLAVKIADKQTVLETVSVAQRLEQCLALMESEISVLQVEKRIRTRVKRQMEKTQREYYLNEQMKAIQKELGDEDEERTTSPSSRSASRIPSSRRRRATKRLPKSRSCGRCHRCRPKRQSCAITSIGFCRSPVGLASQGQEGSRILALGSARCRSLRPRQGQRNASSNISPCRAAPNKLTGPDSRRRRTSWCRQDIAG